MREKSNKNGRLIAIEGIDATGKRTQSLLLLSWLKRARSNCKIMSFPDYTTPIGKEIKAFLAGERRYPKELKQILFAANRWEKLAKIKSVLDTNQILIVNRYTESNLAYGVANGLKLDWLMKIEKGLPKPDLVILLDAPPHLVRFRRPRIQDTYESNQKLQENTATAYRQLAHKFGWKIVNATDNVKQVQRRIRTIVSHALSLESL